MCKRAHVCVEKGEGNGKAVKDREKGMVMWAQVGIGNGSVQA